MRTLALVLLVTASGCSLVNDPGEIEPGPDATIPPAPGGLEAIAGKTSVALQWDPVQVADFDGYVVFAGTISGALSSAGQTTDPSYVVTALSDGTQYHFSVLTVDRAGNASDLAAEVSATPDNTPPTVAFYPSHGASDQNLNVDLVLTFDEPMNRASVEAAVTVTRSDDGTVPGCAWSWDSGDQIAVCNFTADLVYSKTYTASVTSSAADRGGNAIAPASASFTTAGAPDTTRPIVSATIPAVGAVGVVPETTLSITFSEAMNQSLTQTAFQLLTVGGADAAPYRGGVFSWTNGGKTLTYDPPINFPNGAYVTYSVGTGACDLAPSPGPNYLLATFSGNFRAAYQKTLLVESASGLDGYGVSDGGSVTINTSYTTMYVGDDSTTRHYRSWVSFLHGALTPTPTRILAATLSVYQAACFGSPYTALDANRWAWLSGYKCSEVLQDCDYDLLARHVNPGTLGVEDFSAAILASGPELTEAPDAGWVTRSVTSYVQADRAAARGMSQFRLEFPLTTNGDAISDLCAFYTSEHASYGPTLVVTFETATP